jgi:hypothetical protein
MEFFFRLLEEPNVEFRCAGNNGDMLSLWV